MESVERINEMLKLKYGTELNNKVRWRVVRAGEQFEKRIIGYTDNGIFLNQKEVRLVRKYQHIGPEVFVLEWLRPVSEPTDLVEKTSYEPIWSFVDPDYKPLPPRFDACEFIIDTVYSQIDSANTHRKYKDPDENSETREAKLKAVEEELFGNETPVGDALAHRYGVTDFNQKVNFNNE